jgi:hypothetical protein
MNSFASPQTLVALPFAPSVMICMHESSRQFSNSKSIREAASLKKAWRKCSAFDAAMFARC